MPRRNYTAEQKAEAIAVVAVSSSISDASRKLGIPESTLNKWMNGQRLGNAQTKAQIEEIAEQKKEDLGVKMDNLLDKFVDALADASKINNAKVNELATSFGIIFDKRQLLKGQPTAISHSHKPQQTPEEKLQDFIDFVKSKGETIERDDAIKILKAKGETWVESLAVN